MPALPILAITFDLDDTLWAIDPVIERAERRILESTLGFVAVAIVLGLIVRRRLRSLTGS